MKVRSPDATVADYHRPLRLQGVEDLKVVANFMALLRVVSPEWYIKVRKKAKKARASSSGADEDSDREKVPSQSNIKYNKKVKAARDALAFWRNAVYDLIPEQYPSKQALAAKHKLVTERAAAMHAAFLPIKITPYIHHAQHTGTI